MFVKSSDILGERETLRSVSDKYIDGNALYAHLMNVFCCLLVTITG